MVWCGNAFDRIARAERKSGTGIPPFVKLYNQIDNLQNAFDKLTDAVKKMEDKVAMGVEETIRRLISEGVVEGSAITPAHLSRSVEAALRSI